LFNSKLIGRNLGFNTPLSVNLTRIFSVIFGEASLVKCYYSVIIYKLVLYKLCIVLMISKEQIKMRAI